MSTKNPAQSSSTRWHTLTVEQGFERLNSNAGGLSSGEAATRLQQFGPNELQAQRRVSAWAILLEQFKNVLIVILLLATTLSAFLGHGVGAIAITVIVLFAAPSCWTASRGSCSCRRRRSSMTRNSRRAFAS